MSCSRTVNRWGARIARLVSWILRQPARLGEKEGLRAFLVMARERLSRAERIRSSSEFKEVLEKGRAYGGKHLVLFWLKTEQNGTAVGFTTTRRVPNAVARNRARRLMREAYRGVKHGIEGEGLRLVFMARGDTRDLTFEKVRTEMVDLFTGAGLWQG